MLMKYTCAVCKEDCESDESKWTEEDAIKERDELWGDDALFAILCDDCFKEHVTPERMEIYRRERSQNR
jgi:hypothetical protein